MSISAEPKMMLFSPIYSLSIVLYLITILFFQTVVPVWMAAVPAALLMAAVLVAVYILYRRVIDHERRIGQCIEQTKIKERQIYRMSELVNRLTTDLEEAGLHITRLIEDNEKLRGND